jgi:hypothetical protein
VDGSPQFFGSYEVLHGLGESACSVLVASPTAILFRVDRVDFRQTLLKDAQTDQWMRADAREHAARMDARKVLRELAAEARWVDYKRGLVASVLAAHRQAHVLPVGPRPSMASAHRTAREPPLPYLPRPPQAVGSLSARAASGSTSPSSSNNAERRRPSIDADKLPRRPPRSAAHGKWVEVRTLRPAARWRGWKATDGVERGAVGPATRRGHRDGPERRAHRRGRPGRAGAGAEGWPTWRSRGD